MSQLPGRRATRPGRCAGRRCRGAGRWPARRSTGSTPVSLWRHRRSALRGLTQRPTTATEVRRGRRQFRHCMDRREQRGALLAWPDRYFRPGGGRLDFGALATVLVVLGAAGDDRPPRVRPLRRRQAGGHEGDRVFRRFRPARVVGHARARPTYGIKALAPRRLLPHHRHDQRRGGRPGRRAPRLPQPTHVASPDRRSGRLVRAFRARLRDAGRPCSSAPGTSATSSPTRRPATRSRRSTALAKARARPSWPGCSPVTGSSPSTGTISRPGTS